MITGYTRSFGAGDDDVYLVRTDGSGDTLWTRTFGGVKDDGGYSVQQTADGGFIVAGRNNSLGPGWTALYLVRTDSSGNALWERTLGGRTWEYGYSVRQTADDGYVVAGSTDSFGSGYSDVWLVRIEKERDIMIGAANTPAEVVPGSAASWDITLANNGPDPRVADLWLSITSDVLPPPWNPYILLLRENIDLPPWFSGSGTARLHVPSTAPSGTYLIENIVGTHPDDLFDSESFECDVVSP